MSQTDVKWDEFREIIVSACHVLRRVQETEPFFPERVAEPEGDCYVLIHDAARLFCEAVSAHHGQSLARRWSPELPSFLLTHPEKCEEALAMIERKDYEEADLRLAS